ncbi:MAG: DNA repair protein RecN, partial [Thermodesulfovibrionales bacterium]
MLTEIGIKNFAIIKSISVKLGNGLNLITGETGAGKSIIVDAISILLSQRASAEYIKSGQKEAQIEAVFQGIPSFVNSLLDDLSIEVSDELIARRIISNQGKSKAYINDTQVNIQTFVNLLSKLVDIHGQSEHQTLLKREIHLSLLDNFAGLQGELEEYKALFMRTQDVKNQLDNIRKNLKDAIQKEDFLRYQIKEIESADPKADELRDLTEEFTILSHTQRLKELMHEAYDNLYGAEQSGYTKLQKAYDCLQKICEFDPTQRQQLDNLRDAILIVDETSNILRNKKTHYEENPERLNYLSDRIDLLKRLIKKYGQTLDDVIQYKKTAEQELNRIQHSSDEESRLSDELKDLETNLYKMADAISNKRQHSAKIMQDLVVDELKKLGFQNPQFVISITRKQEVSLTGLDVVEFLFSANPGEPPKPINKIASGGELSRLMLALKVVGISEDADISYDPPTIIFDEVDAGIGGVTANNVGKRLKTLSKRYQVLCITHLPQIA